MTIEEQINEAVNTYMNGLFEYGVEIPIEDFENIEEGFVAGANWAYECFKSPWISVEEDLPCNHDDSIYFGTTTLVLTRLEDGDFYVTYMKKSKVTNNWYWVAVKHVTHWMPIPKLND